MTLFRRFALCAALAVCAAIQPASAEPAPGVDALRVAKLATDYLATHGKKAPVIISIVWQKDALFHGTYSWIVRWSAPIKVDGNSEVGMRVRPDGAVSYLIAEKSEAKKPAAP